MLQNKSVEVNDAFNEQLKLALEHFTQPAWLGEHSPLAMPYFLGERLWRRTDAHTAIGRGLALQEVLHEAADILARQDEDGKYAVRLLNLSFFQARILFDVLDILGIARSTYYRHLSKAIQRLGETLIHSINPALHLESPAAHAPLIGRADVLHACLQSLQQGRSVSLIGSGGVGKTTLGAMLAARLAPQPIFWLTLRPGLNDQVSSLLFSLGYFLHRQGASSLWLQLVAEGGKADMRIAPGLLQHDFKRLNNAPVLLCFDDIDLLRPTEAEEHARILTFLESLRGITPLLFMGQQRVIESDSQHTLKGLALPELAQLLAQRQLQLSETDVARLYEYTAGNPRLVELFMTLHRSGEPLTEALQRVSAAPSIELVLSRIWRRLNSDQRHLLNAVAVFRRFTPGDAWKAQQATLDQLIDYNLIQQDNQGGVALLPALRMVVYELLAAEEREIQHLNAAQIRASRGQHTAAAYHYLNGGKPEMAIRYWYLHREQEIDQGQAGIALSLFSQISQNQLSEDDRRLLILLRSELRTLLGDYDKAREELQSTFWPPDQIATLRAQELAGEIAVRQDQIERALAQYQAGLTTVSTLLEREAARFHVKLGKVYALRRDLAKAWREAQLARHEVDHFQGYLQVKLGNYAQARRHYLDALAIAEELDYAEGIAKTCDNLAKLLATQEQIDQAAEFWERSIQHYKSTGNISQLARVKANQAGLHGDLGQAHAAIAPGEEALELFRRLGEPHGRAHAAYNLASAYLALGNLDTAAHFAHISLQEQQISIRPYCLSLLGEIRLAQGRLLEAEDFSRAAIEAAECAQDLRMTAQAWRVLGRVYVAQDSGGQARAALENAIELFQQLDLPREVEQTNELLASIQGFAHFKPEMV